MNVIFVEQVLKQYLASISFSAGNMEMVHREEELNQTFILKLVKSKLFVQV